MTFNVATLILVTFSRFSVKKEGFLNLNYALGNYILHNDL